MKKQKLHGNVPLRRQDGFVVEVILWPKAHTWIIYLGGPDYILVDVDRPLDQEELFRWLAKTQPIE